MDFLSTKPIGAALQEPGALSRLCKRAYGSPGKMIVVV